MVTVMVMIMVKVIVMIMVMLMDMVMDMVMVRVVTSYLHPDRLMPLCSSMAKHDPPFRH